MLSAAEVQRYARQILLAQVGRLGQERWLASRVAAAGGGHALDTAVELLTAAGVHVDRGEMPSSKTARLAGLWLGETAFADSRAACEACLTALFEAQPPAPPEELAASAFATGAAAAGEVLLQLLDPTRYPLCMALVPEPRRVAAAREGCACRA
jgi:hypothetical protein